MKKGDDVQIVFHNSGHKHLDANSTFHNVTHTIHLHGLDVELVEASVEDPSAVGRAMEGVEIVFHEAALRITHCAAEPRMAIEVMIDATFELLEACRLSQVSKIVMASSASVYGMAEQFPTTEANHPYANQTVEWTGTD